MMWNVDASAGGGSARKLMKTRQPDNYQVRTTFANVVDAAFMSYLFLRTQLKEHPVQRGTQGQGGGSLMVNPHPRFGGHGGSTEGDSASLSMSEGGGGGAKTTPAAPKPQFSHEEYGIRDVWDENLEEEFLVIRQLSSKYHYVAMDTEFPGVVAKPYGQFRTDSEYAYHMLKVNVDLLKVIQIGISFFDGAGDLLKGRIHTWQFNFKFDLE